MEDSFEHTYPRDFIRGDLRPIICNDPAHRYQGVLSEFTRFKKPWYSLWNFITVRNFIGKGNNDFGFLKYFVLFIGGADLLVNASATLGILLTGLYIIFSFIWGYNWDKRKWTWVEHHWSNERQHWISFTHGFENAKHKLGQKQ